MVQVPERVSGCMPTLLRLSKEEDVRQVGRGAARALGTGTGSGSGTGSSVPKRAGVAQY